MIVGRHVNKYYLKYILFFIIGVLALIIIDYFQLNIPKICGEIIDGLSTGELIDDNIITEYMRELGLIAVIMFGGRFLWRYSVLGVSVRIEAGLREDMFIHAEKLSNRYYKEHKTGALMALFTNDLQVIRQSFGMGTVMIVDAIFLGVLALYRMFEANWMLAIFSLVPMMLISIVSFVIGRVMQKRFKARQEAYDSLSDFSQENFSGISVIKAFVKEIQEIRHFKKVNQENYDKNIEYAKYSTILNVLLAAIISTTIAILLGGGAYFVINGINDDVFTPGELVAFIAYFDTLVWPLMAVGQLMNMRAQAKASYQRISELLDTPIEIVDNETVSVDNIQGKIEFKNLNFTYPDGSNLVLKDISFTINQGEMVGIIGKTGCGKTTIVDLLLRTYNIEHNQIFIDDIDIMQIPFKKVRESIGYVPQDNFLFSDTIANNIGFATKTYNTEMLEEAARLADVHNSISAFNAKYGTMLGERGVTLSGGQKQRVSIARALLKNPAILILDDSVSAVDTKTEDNILNNLKELREGKTTIVIAHRISTVESLDKIILMNEGQIIGFGTHKELLEMNATYKNMVKLQSLENHVNGGDF
ncbi:MAG: ABC transporter ATP-binding protein [Acholeplasmatales bacterium]|nr:ABC transporter ATP-binding protein [Acholeplasmatales bacterium]